MVKIIMGLKGSGKTKKLVDMVRQAVEEDNGSVVCIEKEKNLTFDIPYQARLVETDSYGINNYECLKGLICGLHAGNYDITHFFIDNFFKIVGTTSVDDMMKFTEWLSRFSDEEKIDFVISMSMDTANVPESFKSYLI